MSAWDNLKLRLTAQPQQRIHPMSVDGAEWTVTEESRLSALRQQVQTYGPYHEFGLDRYRLEFVRWLVVHGKLSEDLRQ